MTAIPALMAIMAPAKVYPPKWIYQHTKTPRVTNEGDPNTFSIKCDNSVVGSRVQISMTGANGLASASNWLRPWSSVIKEVVEPLGCTYRTDTANTVPAKNGTFSCLITVGPDYVPGTIMEFTNTTKKDRKNNAANFGDIRGGAGSFQIFLRPVTLPALTAPDTPATVYGTLGASIGSGFYDIRDTSRRPEGYPTLKMRTIGADGLTAPSILEEGTSFEVVLETENMVPGTQIKLYAANDGQNDLDPGWRSIIANAAKQVPGITCFVPKYTAATANEWFNGGILTYTDEYNNDTPFRATLTVQINAEVENTRQFDLIGQVIKQGDASTFDTILSRGDYSNSASYTLGDYVRMVDSGRYFIMTDTDDVSGYSPPTDDTTYSNDSWRELILIQVLSLGVTKQFRDRPTTYWELQASPTPDENRTANYRIGYPITSEQFSTVILQSENTPPGFIDSLVAATPPDRYVPAQFHYEFKRVASAAVPWTEARYYSGKLGTTVVVPAETIVSGYGYDPDDPSIPNYKAYFDQLIVGQNRDYYYVPAGKVTYVAGSYSGVFKFYGNVYVEDVPATTFKSALTVTNVTSSGGVDLITLTCNVTPAIYKQYFAGVFPSVSFNVPDIPASFGKHKLRLITADATTGFITIPDASMRGSLPTMPPEPANIYGYNGAGGEFGNIFANGTTAARTTYGGGRYYYPSNPQDPDPAKRHQSMDYFWGKGMRIMRLPVKWERVQRSLYGELYYGPDVPFTSTNDLDMRRINEVISYWTGLGGYILFNVHNYMGYQIDVKRDDDGNVILKSNGEPEAISGKVKYDSLLGIDVHALIDLWVKLANTYASNPKVWFGIMNEPSGDGATAFRNSKNMQAVVNGIRSRTEATNKLLIAGSSYSNTKRWVDNGVAASFDNFYDPLDNFAFEPHNYIDSDQSGTKGTCVVQTATNNQLIAFTNWARDRGFKGFLGEFAGGNPATVGSEQCAISVPAVYKYMKDNKDVWIGWTTWAAGFQTSYIFSLEPLGGYTNPTDNGAMKMVEPFLEPY